MTNFNNSIVLNSENIISLLDKIYCQINKLGLNLYNNNILLLNHKINVTDLQKLLIYKQILLKKHKNNDYLSCVSGQEIHDKVINLTIGCKSKCCQ